MRAVFFAFLTVIACSTSGLAQAQQGLSGQGSDNAGMDNNLQNGRFLALMMCSSCHVVGPDQLAEPILRPPAPSFESIAQRRDASADAIRTFLATTHRNIGNERGMPNPALLDYQSSQVVAYVLSLRTPPAAAANRKPPTIPAEPCLAKITRLERQLSEKGELQQPVGSVPESSAARLHRQPTPQSLKQARREAQANVDTTLAFARQLDADGLNAECLAMLQRLELSLGSQ
jgi:mono/diheme cytochrome c family protein